MNVLLRNVTLVSNVSYSGQAQVVFQNRNISVVQGSITDILPPYGSAVYRFPLIKSTYAITFGIASVRAGLDC